MKLQRKVNIKIRNGEHDILVGVPSALDCLKYEEAFREATDSSTRYSLSVELLEGCVDDIQSYPVMTVIEMAQQVTVYVFVGDIEKKPEDTQK